MAAPKPIRNEKPSPRKLRAPTCDEIRAGRAHAGHTQEQAAAEVQATARRWREWEAGDAKMHPGLWELYLIHTTPVLLSEPELDEFTIEELIGT